jgi:transcription elongation factor Elf1
MTTNIIAIDENELKCPECGNSDPRKIILRKEVRAGHDVRRYSLVCKVCETSIGFDVHGVANSTRR